MSSKGGYATPHPNPLPSYGGERFYNPPPVRRYQQIIIQHQQVVQRQQQQLMLQKQQQQLQRRALAEYSGGGGGGGVAAEDDKQRTNGGDDSSLCIPPCVVAAPVSSSKATNLDRLMESVAPFVMVQYLSEVKAKELRTREVDKDTFFSMKDLCESFSEWSAYGAGVPLLLKGKEPIDQYYVPFLSGLQLYIDPSKPSSRLSGSSEQSDIDLNKLTSFEADVANSPGVPFFQYLEHQQPHHRRPLADKLSALLTEHPEVSKLRSCDLLPTSWICVAWYPIYRIPVGPTLQDLDASFLTFHSLSTQSTIADIPAPQFHNAYTRKVNDIVDPTAKISLPVFGIASYKLKGSILSPCGPQECKQEQSLLQAADNWLRNLKVSLPDYQFFRSSSSYHRRR